MEHDEDNAEDGAILILTQEEISTLYNALHELVNDIEEYTKEQWMAEMNDEEAWNSMQERRVMYWKIMNKFAEVW